METETFRQQVVAQTERHVRRDLSGDTSGHDWWHVHRVRRLALEISRTEPGDRYVIELAALLHDISDYKLNGGDHEAGPRAAYEWLVGLGEGSAIAAAVSEIIATMSFSGAGDTKRMTTLEGCIVQDADRLDALGAIGIARTFAYGGYAGQAMHDPDLHPVEHANADQYFKKTGTTINHFYEKLLLLVDRMNTETARRIAHRRHQVLQHFLDDFLREWDGRDAEDFAQLLDVGRPTTTRPPG